MANATRIKNAPAPQFRTNRVALNLSAEEAYALQVILGFVGGDPASTPRAYSDKILESLELAMPEVHFEEKMNMVRPSGSIYFMENTKGKFLEYILELDQKEPKS